MAYEVLDTTDWPRDRILRYVPDINKAFAKMVRRYPDDCTVEGLWNGVIRGERVLWLILEDGKFRSFFLSQPRIVNSTGVHLETVTTAAGDGAVESFPDAADAFIPYARSRNADIIQVESRRGWWPGLKALGFKEVAAIYRLDLRG